MASRESGAGGAVASLSGGLIGRPARAWSERLIAAALFLCGLISVLTTVGIVVVLVRESLGFFGEVSLLEFLTDTEWSALFADPSFGVLPLVNGTLIVAVGSAVIALPAGLATAIYLSEYADDRVRSWVKPVLEILAGVPTVVYGYFALTFITPILRTFLPGTSFYNAASASIVVGVMILPMVSSLSEDALSAVPDSLRRAAYGLGATKFEVSTRVAVPSALSGIVASFILAVSRAIGETMAVTLAAGATPKMTASYLESIQTMTSYIVQVATGDVPQGGVVYRSIFAVGLLLFLMTLVMNLASERVTRRFREVYE